nr:MATE family efflux transporter [Oscillospiraceae bacterium]
MFRLLRRGPDFYRTMLRLVLPIMLQNLVSVSLALFDTFMVGMLGEAPMSAVTLANSPIFVIQLLTFGFQSGSAVLISQYWGKGDTESISRVIGIALYVAGAVSLSFALALFFAPVPIMGLLTNNAELAAIAARYAKIV